MKVQMALIPVGFIILSMSFFAQTIARASLDGTRVHSVEPKKTQSYVREGLVVGGDRQVTQVEIKEIRRAMNNGFERVVLDLNSRGTPYYQVAVEPEMKRIVFTVFGQSQLGFDPLKVIAGFKKSTLVSRIDLYPKLDENSWTFALNLKTVTPVEVFELAAPTRIIFDLKTQAPATSYKASDED
jgi:hypothetical protein